MNDDSFSWPDDPEECSALARSMFISECVLNTRYWLDWGSHLLTYPQPNKPHIRSWSELAKEDTAFREVFGTLNEQQRSKVIELLQRCISGAVFSTLCTLDQFPHGEVEVLIHDGDCGSNGRKFRLTPTDIDLHDSFTEAFNAQP